MRKNSKMNNLEKTVPYKIVDYKVETQHEIFYLVLWDEIGMSQQWVQDTQLVGADKVIEEFFTRMQIDQYLLLEEEEKGRGENRTGLTRPRQTEWNVTYSQQLKDKFIQRKLKKSKAPRRSKKYVDQDANFFASKIAGLEQRIQKRECQYPMMDHLVDYIESIFMKQEGPFCTLRTFAPVRTFAVSLGHMQVYFPRTLKNYYSGLLGLHERKMEERRVANEGSDFEESGSSKEDGTNGRKSSEKEQAEMRESRQSRPVMMEEQSEDEMID